VLDGHFPAHARRVAIDCANGATHEVAPALLMSLGFEVTAIGCEPDGRNINLDCAPRTPGASRGSCRTGLRFRRGVRRRRRPGDSRRRAGRIVDGDAVMFLCAKRMQAAGRLRGDAVVATVMSNIGLEIALRDLGIGLVRTPVGDKYVMEELLRDNLSLGGEQSRPRHLPDFLYTGDGIVTALSVLRVMAETGRSLADLAGELRTYPQVLLNLRVREKRDWMTIPGAARAIADVEGKLAGRGRLLVRYSGTEPLLRVMLERGTPGRHPGLGGADRRAGEGRDRRMTGVING